MTECDLCTRLCPKHNEIKNLANGRMFAIKELAELCKKIDNGTLVEVVRCRECKHRPTKPEKYVDGFDLEFPDDVCPCQCDDDPYYSWYPRDEWFCPRGERKGGDE